MNVRVLINGVQTLIADSRGNSFAEFLFSKLFIKIDKNSETGQIINLYGLDFEANAFSYASVLDHKLKRKKFGFIKSFDKIEETIGTLKKEREDRHQTNLVEDLPPPDFPEDEEEIKSIMAKMEKRVKEINPRLIVVVEMASSGDKYIEVSLTDTCISIIPPVLLGLIEVTKMTDDMNINGQICPGKFFFYKSCK